MWIYLKIFMVWQLLSPSAIYLSSSAVSMLRRPGLGDIDLGDLEDPRSIACPTRDLCFFANHCGSRFLYHIRGLRNCADVCLFFTTFKCEAICFLWSFGKMSSKKIHLPASSVHDLLISQMEVTIAHQ